MSIKTSIHPDYAHNAKRWEINRDFCSGSEAVKAKGRVYLPDDNELYVGGKPAGESIVGPEGDPFKYERKYRNLLQRASFNAIAQHTRNGWTGMMFNKDPIIELPAQIEYMRDNVDGAGQTLVQLAKKEASEGIEVGRMGLLVDMPTTGGNLSIAEEVALNIRPRIASYVAEAIKDWDEMEIGAVKKLSFVKLREEIFDRDDEFSDYGECKVQYRILRLRDDDGEGEDKFKGYTQEVIDENGEVLIKEKLIKAQGKPLDYIPFFFVGSENNKPDVDDAPVSPVVDVNLAHYLTSADFEELNHLYSLPTPSFNLGDNISVEEFQKANPRGVTKGEGLVGGKLEIAQIEANGALLESLKLKEEQAEKLGAVVSGDGKSQNVTAEAARINAAFITATLTKLVGNISEATRDALQAACEFVPNANPEEVVFELERDFFDKAIDAPLVAQIKDLYDQEVLNVNELRMNLKDLGIKMEEG